MNRIVSLFRTSVIAFCAVMSLFGRLAAENLIYVGAYDSLSNAKAVALEGRVWDENYAFVADQGMGLVIFAVSQSASPYMVGIFHPSMGWAFDVDVRGDTAYLTTGSSEPYMGALYIVDVTDKQNPTQFGSISFSWEIMAVEVEGNYAYLADAMGTLHIVDISDPTNPILISSRGISAMELYKSDYLYAACGSQGLKIVDVTNPADPQVVGICNTPGLAMGVTLRERRNSFAYIADGDSGMQIIDVRNSSNPTIAGHLQTSDRATDIVGGRYFVYVALQDSGIVAVTVGVPWRPWIVGWGDTPGVAQGIDVDLGIAVANGESLEFFRTDLCSCVYLPGDVNGNGDVNGIDVGYAVNFLKGFGPPPPSLCPCPPHGDIYVGGDVNASCVFNGVDVTYLLHCYEDGGQSPMPCPDCPPDY
jgi:hypothetical protein